MDKPYIPTLIDGDSYYQVDRVNQTLLKKVLQSPAHARQYLLHPPEPTPAMRLGTALHLALLEPHLYEQQVVVQPDFNRRTNDGKLQYSKWLDSTKDKTVLTSAQSVTCIQAAQSLARHSVAMRLINAGKHEVSIGFEDIATGLQCKCRCDVLDTPNKCVNDVKSAMDGSYKGFQRACVNFDYALQSSFYLRGASGYPTGIAAHKAGWRFNFVVVETSAPYGVAVYQLDQRAICHGDDLCDEALKSWADAKVLDQYADYPDEIQMLSLPPWALRESE